MARFSRIFPRQSEALAPALSSGGVAARALPNHRASVWIPLLRSPPQGHDCAKYTAQIGSSNRHLYAWHCNILQHCIVKFTFLFLLLHCSFDASALRKKLLLLQDWSQHQSESLILSGLPAPGQLEECIAFEQPSKPSRLSNGCCS